MLFKKALERIEKNKELKESGVQLCVPYPFPRLNEYLVGIDKGQAIGLLGSTGVGKSFCSRFMFLYSVYKYYKETGYKVRVIYFAMEDSKEQTYDFVICNYLAEYHNIRVTPKDLNSRTKPLSDYVISKLKEAEEYFAELEQVVTFIDGITEPTEMYEICKEIAMNTGKVTSWTENIHGREIKQYKYESDYHTIAIFDNMSNIDTEDGISSDQLAILKFVKEYMRLKLCNFFKWTTVLVMQSDFETERQSFNKSGDTMIAKVEPTLASIGDSKRSSRSFHLIFSLFSPQRYEIPYYPSVPKGEEDKAYNIGILGNKFRSIRVIKSNQSDVGMRVPLLCDMVSGTFQELPKPETEELNEIYEKLSGVKVPVNYGSNIKPLSSIIKQRKTEGDDDLPF